MRVKRVAIAVVGCLLATMFAFTAHANASISRTCSSDLLDDRFAAVDDLISAQHFFTRDTTAFIDAVFDDESVGELTVDYNSSLRDLRQDLGAGRRDIASDRQQAIDDLSSGRCSGVSSTRVHREMRFYHRMNHRLNVAYLQSRLALTNAYQAAVASCCF
jgi:hypothetical protein